jgi:alpha,alpha-trehalase
LEDYETANGAEPALNETEKERLYVELASGAESGWDYSVRWATERIVDLESQFPILRKLGVVATIPVDLTSLMRGNHALVCSPECPRFHILSESIQRVSKAYIQLANLYQVLGNETQSNNTSTNTGTNSNATTQSQYHQQVADNLTAAALDLHWDPEKAWFYDYNTTSSNRSDIFGPHGTFALWQNITPPELYNNETLGLKMVSGWRYLLGKYAGIPSPATLIAAGLNWDFPNAWPPHACAYTSFFCFILVLIFIGSRGI